MYMYCLCALSFIGLFFPADFQFLGNPKLKYIHVYKHVVSPVHWPTCILIISPSDNFAHNQINGTGYKHILSRTSAALRRMVLYSLVLLQHATHNHSIDSFRDKKRKDCFSRQLGPAYRLARGNDKRDSR